MASSGALSGGQTVRTPTTLSLSSSENPSNYDDSVTFTAGLAPTNGTPTGTVQFQVDGSNLGAAVPVTNELRSLLPREYYNYAVSEADTFPYPAGGNFTITAVYSGDGKYMGSSGTLTQTVIGQPK
jgi:hypothetical protein